MCYLILIFYRNFNNKIKSGCEFSLVPSAIFVRGINIA